MPINSSQLGLGSTDRHFNEVRLFWRLMRLGHIEICVLERLGEENFQKHSIPCDEGTLCILFQLDIWAPIQLEQDAERAFVTWDRVFLEVFFAEAFQHTNLNMSQPHQAPEQANFIEMSIRRSEPQLVRVDRYEQ